MESCILTNISLHQVDDCLYVGDGVAPHFLLGFFILFQREISRPAPSHLGGGDCSEKHLVTGDATAQCLSGLFYLLWNLSRSLTTVCRLRLEIVLRLLDLQWTLHWLPGLGRAGLYQINNHLEPSLGIKRAVSLSEAMLIAFCLYCFVGMCSW